MTTVEITPHEIESIQTFSDVFNVTIDEIRTACRDEELTNEFITTYNEYGRDDTDDTITSLSELTRDETLQLAEEVLPGREYAFMVRVLDNRTGTYFCEMGDDNTPHRFFAYDDRYGGNDNTEYDVPNGVLQKDWRELHTAQHPTTEKLLADDEVTEETPPQEVLQRYTAFGSSKPTRPRVLSYQVETTVGETLFEETALTLLYEYEREGEVTTAWRIEESTDALVRYRVNRGDGDDWDTMWWVPPLGETQSDLRWMTIHSLALEDEDITITECSENTLKAILSMTRQCDMSGVEQVLRSQMPNGGLTDGPESLVV